MVEVRETAEEPVVSKTAPNASSISRRASDGLHQASLIRPVRLTGTENRHREDWPSIATLRATNWS
jgi:hypothetical protein